MIFDVQFMLQSLLKLLDILPFTLFITITPLVLGLLLGIVVASIRLYKIKIISQVSELYVSFFRGTPIMLHIFIIYFGVPQLLDWLFNVTNISFEANLIPTTAFIIIAFTLTSGAYFSEIVRAGILGVNKGEVEAAYALGMTPVQMLRRVVLPQALLMSMPNLCNSFVNIFHGTSLAFYISVMELTGTATILASHNSRYLETFLAAGVIYWVVSVVIELVAHRFEKKLKVYSQNV